MICSIAPYQHHSRDSGPCRPDELASAVCPATSTMNAAFAYSAFPPAGIKADKLMPQNAGMEVIDMSKQLLAIVHKAAAIKAASPQEVLVIMQRISKETKAEIRRLITGHSVIIKMPVKMYAVEFSEKDSEDINAMPFVLRVNAESRTEARKKFMQHIKQSFPHSKIVIDAIYVENLKIKQADIP